MHGRETSSCHTITTPGFSLQAVQARDPAGLQRASASSIDSAGGLAHHEAHPVADYDPLTTGELGDAEPEPEESEDSRQAVDKAALQQHLSLEAARWGQRVTSELDNALSVAGEAGSDVQLPAVQAGWLSAMLVGGGGMLCVLLWRRGEDIWTSKGCQ